MKILTSTLCAFVILTMICSPVMVSALSLETEPKRPAVSITEDGTATVVGLTVVQIAGSTIFGRTTWDQSFIRWTIKTGKDTKLQKRFGDPLTVADFKVNDILSIEGFIEGGSTLSIVAKKIVNWSNFEATGAYSGTITALGTNGTSFTMQHKTYGDIQVTHTSNTTILRNRREISSKYARVGDVITTIEGVYDHKLKTLAATKIVIYIDPTIFKAQNYQGTLKSLPDPQTKKFSLEINGKIYTIVPTETVTILNTKRGVATFDRFLLGDTVRVYGFIREDNDELDTMTASVIRNLNF